MRLDALDPVVTAVFGRRFPRWDAFMVTLAFVDVVALTVYREVPALPEAWRARLLVLDGVILAIFAMEFLGSLARAKARGRFARANWYDIVGLVPLPIPLLRAFRLLRVAHVLIWGTRFPHLAEREWGGAYAVQVIRANEKRLVDALTEPLLIRLVQVLRNAVGRGRYAQAFGEALEARRPRLREALLRAIERKPALRLALLAPGAKRAVTDVQDELVDVLVDVLTEPELDAVIKESLDEALAGLQSRIRDRADAAADGPVEVTVAE